MIRVVVFSIIIIIILFGAELKRQRDSIEK